MPSTACLSGSLAGSRNRLVQVTSGLERLLAPAFESHVLEVLLQILESIIILFLECDLLSLVTGVKGLLPEGVRAGVDLWICLHEAKFTRVVSFFFLPFEFFDLEFELINRYL